MVIWNLKQEILYPKLYNSIKPTLKRNITNRTLSEILLAFLWLTVDSYCSPHPIHKRKTSFEQEGNRKAPLLLPDIE